MINSQLLVGECRAVMRTLPERCVQTCITSPPYWGLRDYGLPPVEWADGTSAVLGLEATREEFIAHLVEVFQDVRRILRDDGTLWLNLGDSYGQDTKWGGATGGKHAKGLHGTKFIGRNRTTSGRKCGELVNMPHRVAEALAADGWYWRSTVIWHKRSPMPESLSGYRWRRHRLKVRPSIRHNGKYGGTDAGPSRGMGLHRAGQDGRIDAKAKFVDCPGCEKCTPHGGYVLRRGKWRPTAAHEYVFLFSKCNRYFCDGDAVSEQAKPESVERMLRGFRDIGRENNYREGFHRGDGYFHKRRNPRSVWTLSSEPYRGPHFATFPTRLVKRCIEASTSAVGCCQECEACYAPVIDTERIPTRPALNNKSLIGDSLANLDPERHVSATRVLGYRPTCNCGDRCELCAGTLTGEGCRSCRPIPALVLDPFAGSGTTLQTARVLGRRWLGIEMSEAYALQAEKRIYKIPRWATRGVDVRQRELFPASCIQP